MLKLTAREDFLMYEMILIHTHKHIHKYPSFCLTSRIYTFFLTWRIKSLQVLFLKLNEAKIQNGISVTVSAI